MGRIQRATSATIKILYAKFANKCKLDANFGWVQRKIGIG